MQTGPRFRATEDLADPDHPIWVWLYENHRRKLSVRLQHWVGRNRNRLLIVGYITFVLAAVLATLLELIAFGAFR